MSTPPIPTRVDEMEQGPPYDEKLAKKKYKKELEALQIELLKAQRSIRESGDRVVILFEGRDAAGKGGSIKRITEHMNPRSARVVALAKPSDTERTQWYFQRYVSHLPSAGEIVLFDRSWYNRAGVENVMGFCTPREHAQFLRQVPGFEAALVSSGIQLFKLWFTVSREEQQERFASRRSDPLRQWKLSPIDEASISRFDDYTASRNEMLLATDTALSSWTIINSNEKRRARLGSIHAILNALSYANKNASVANVPDPRVVRPAGSLAIEG
jgi:polyphosphate kinase 2